MPKNARPLIASSVALRALATGVTFVSTVGMTAFAASHVQNTAAPLKPAAPAAVVAQATATPAPTATSRRTTVTGRVATTTAAPRTKTHSS
jgi:hypothetical protein